jgi:hypothetical protein
MNECRFELKDLRCANCNRLTGNLGTCDDVDLCAKCRRDYDEANHPNASAKLIVKLIEGHKFHPVIRAVHLSSNGQTLCGRKGNHNTTAEAEDVTCKRCKQAASTIGLAGI